MPAADIALAEIERRFGRRPLDRTVIAPVIVRPAPVLGPVEPSRPHVVCAGCGETFQWFYVADGACAGCWARGGAK